MKEKLERRFLAKLEKVNHISENQHILAILSYIIGKYL